MSIIMQSWGAVAATTLVKLHAGSLTFCQACAMIVGQSVRAAAASAMVAIGRGLAVRRAALAHIVYNVSIGVLGILLLGPFTAAAGWVGSRLDDPESVLALAAFSSVFKFLGFLAFYPWLDRFPRLIIVISGTGSQSAVNRLAPILGEAGRAVALEAGWRTTLELALGSVDAVRRRLTGEVVRYESPVEAVRQIEDFLESPSLETTDLSTFEPRLIWLSHALDHLRQLHDNLTRVPRAVGDWHTSAGFEAGGALADWIVAAKDPRAAPDLTVLKALKAASKRSSNERRTDRKRMLEDVALQRVRTAAARAALEALACADHTLHHAWRLAESLTLAAAQPASRRFASP